MSVMGSLRLVICVLWTFVILVVPVERFIKKGALTVLWLSWHSFVRVRWWIKLEDISHEEVLIEISRGDCCEFYTAEFHKQSAWFFRDKRYIPKITKQVIDTSNTDLFR